MLRGQLKSPIVASIVYEYSSHKKSSDITLYFLTSVVGELRQLGKVGSAVLVPDLLDKVGNFAAHLGVLQGRRGRDVHASELARVQPGREEAYRGVPHHLVVSARRRVPLVCAVYRRDPHHVSPSCQNINHK